MKVKDILNRVTALYNDADYDRVSQTNYLRFLDDAINQILLVRPDASVKTSNVTLAAGNRQSMPSDAYALIDIYRNASSSSSSPIVQVERNNLDYFSEWYSGPRTHEIKEFIYDIRSPKTFWVSPASDGTSIIEMDYTPQPTEFADSSDTFTTVLEQDIALEEVFRSALVAYMLFLLYSTDSSSTLDAQFAGSYLAQFNQILGTELSSAANTAPKIGETNVGINNG